MKAVILAGGKGTRISEETYQRPKPMIEIGGRPILWHILKIYSNHGIHDFVICCGYLGYMIKEFFANYYLHTSDITIDMQSNQMKIHENHAEPWRVTLVDTGEDTMTGGRLKRIAKFVGDETFCCTYGDGLSDINIRELLGFHRHHHTKATMTAVKPPGRFGALRFEGDQISSFQEKPSGDGSWVNGGFFVLEPEIFEYITDDNTLWEADPLEKLAKERQLTGYRHHGFWQPMDTLRDKVKLQELWDSGQAPWKVWS